MAPATKESNNSTDLESGSSGADGISSDHNSPSLEDNGEKHLSQTPKELEVCRLPPREIHGVLWVLVVVATISTMFLFGLDQTLTADVQPAIIRRFSSLDKMPWVSVALLLGASASNLFWGQIYANYNSKWVYMVCFVIFEVGSALCGASPNIDTLIVGRAFCGIGGSGMYNGVMTILSLSTTDEERALYLSIPGLAWGSSTVLGPVIGGAFTVSKVGWRWGFYINLCVGAACAPVLLLLLPSQDPRKDIPWTSLERLKNIDVLGFVLLVGVFLTLLMGINFGGLVYAWDSGSVIALFVVAGLLILVFSAQTFYSWGVRKGFRSFPIQFLSNLTMVVNFFNETCSATACFLSIYFVPVYFQFIRGDTALMAGVRLLPYMAFLIVTNIMSGYIMSNIFPGRYFPFFYIGGALILIGGTLMYTVDETTSTASIYGYNILLGIGTGAYLQIPFAVAQIQVPNPELVSVAVGFVAFAQLAAPAVTLSMANTIFLNRAIDALRQILPDASHVTLQNIISGVGQEYLDQLPSSTRQEIMHVIAMSISRIYILLIAAGGLTLVLTAILNIKLLLSRKK